MRPLEAGVAANSLDNYQQTKYEKLSNDRAKGQIHAFHGQHFTFTNNNTMQIYHIMQDDNGNKYNVLKILNLQTRKFVKYKLKYSSIINILTKYILKPSIVIVNAENKDNNNNYDLLFIKYSRPLNEYNDMAEEYIEADWTGVIHSDERVDILGILRINNTNKTIVDEQLINMSIANGKNNNNYDLFSAARLFPNFGRSNQLFYYNNECHALACKTITKRSVDDNPFYSYAHCKYDAISNKFVVQHIIQIDSEYSNLDIITFEKLLFLFETYTLGRSKGYYLKIHKYNLRNDTWTVNKIKDPPNLLRYCCCAVMKGGWIVVFDKSNRHNNEFVYLVDIKHYVFIKTKWIIPICAEFHAVRIDNERNEELVVHGFIREICNNNYQMPPKYLLNCVAGYYSNEKIYLFCSSVNRCVQYAWAQNVENHNYYRFRTWIFPADILFEQ